MSGNSNASEVGQFCYWLGFSLNHAEGLIISKLSHPLLFFFFLARLWGLQDLSSLTRDPSNLGPQQWKCRVLTTGAPGTSQ